MFTSLELQKTNIYIQWGEYYALIFYKLKTKKSNYEIKASLYFVHLRKC